MPIHHHPSIPLRPTLRLLGLVCLVLCVPATWAQQSAGRIMVVNGTAKAVNAQGQERNLEKGGEVFAGEKIVTAEGGLVQMRLHDGGYLSVRPSTEMVIDRFVYDDKNAANSNFLVSLVRGGFRSITGLIGRTNPAAYQIRTTTATLGIRGTDHEPMVVPEGLPGPSGLTPPGIYDKVNDGETFIQNRFGVLSLKRGDVGFAPAKPDIAPQMLQRIPDFYKLELKTDGRDSKDAAEDNKPGNAKTLPKGALLRPSLALRKDAVLTDNKTDTTKTIEPTTPLTAPVLSSTVLQPITVVKEPLTTTLTVPTTTLISPTTTLPPITNTLISPTTTVISPVTTVTPITTTVIPTTTLIVPRTTTIITTTPLVK